MHELGIIVRNVCNGASPWRALMKARLAHIPIAGLTVDVGSGRKRSYAHAMPHMTPVTIRTVDQKGTADTPPTFFGKDALPFRDGTVDTVLLFNLLEHLFLFQRGLADARRILAPEGRLVIFVPFFCPYHEGPEDFFRYTHAALARALADAGFSASRTVVTPLGFGPCTVAFHLLFLSVPSACRVLRRAMGCTFFPLALFFDSIIRRYRPLSVRDFPLGYQCIACV